MALVISIHAALILCCCIAIEIFIQSKFKLILTSLRIVSKKVFKVLKSEKISDCWKEKIIPFYAISMFKYSIKSFFILAIIVFVFFLPSFFIVDFIYFSISLHGIIESIIFCVAYLKIRTIIFWIVTLHLKSYYTKLPYLRHF